MKKQNKHVEKILGRRKRKSHKKCSRVVLPTNRNRQLSQPHYKCNKRFITMKKILITFSVIALFCACGGTEKKQISKSDSLSAVIDSAAAKDTLLLKLKNN